MRSLLKVLAILGLVVVLIAVGIFFVLYKAIAIPEPNEAFEAQTTFVYYSGGKDELGTYYDDQNRQSIPLSEMPQTMQDAVVAAENQTFWTDKGLDPKGIIRAAFSNARGNAQQGASTITQQYVKILYLTSERSYQRKVKEAIVSLKIQQPAEQGADPRGLSQHHLLRPRRLRHPGCGGRLLRQGGQGSHPPGERRPRDHAEQPVALRPGQRQGSQRSAQGSLRLRPRRHGRHGHHHGGGGREGRQATAEVPQDRCAEPVRWAARPHARPW